MFDNIILLVVASTALVTLSKNIKNPAAAIAMGMVLVCLLAVTATLTRDTTDLVSVIDALTRLMNTVVHG